MFTTVALDKLISESFSPWRNQKPGTMLTVECDGESCRV